MGEDDGDTAGDLSSTRSALSLSARGEEEVRACDGQHVRQHRRAPVEHRNPGVHGAPPTPRRWTWRPSTRATTRSMATGKSGLRTPVTGVEQVHLAEVVRSHDCATHGAEWPRGDLVVAAHEQVAAVVIRILGNIYVEEQPGAVGEGVRGSP